MPRSSPRCSPLIVVAALLVSCAVLPRPPVDGAGRAAADGRAATIMGLAQRAGLSEVNVEPDAADPARLRWSATGAFADTLTFAWALANVERSCSERLAFRVLRTDPRVELAVTGVLRTERLAPGCAAWGRIEAALNAVRMTTPQS